VIKFENLVTKKHFNFKTELVQWTPHKYITSMIFYNSAVTAIAWLSDKYSSISTILERETCNVDSSIPSIVNIGIFNIKENNVDFKRKKRYIPVDKEN
jgi:hypothetical protein